MMPVVWGSLKGVADAICFSHVPHPLLFHSYEGEDKMCGNFEATAILPLSVAATIPKGGNPRCPNVEHESALGGPLIFEDYRLKLVEGSWIERHYEFLRFCSICGCKVL